MAEEQYVRQEDGRMVAGPALREDCESRGITKRGLIVTIVACVLALVVTGVLLVVLGGSDSRPERRPAPVASAPSAAQVQASAEQQLELAVTDGADASMAAKESFLAPYPECIDVVQTGTAPSPRSAGAGIDDTIHRLEASAPRPLVGFGVATARVEKQVAWLVYGVACEGGSDI